MSFAPSKLRPRSHWKKLTQLALVLFHALSGTQDLTVSILMTAIATRIATFSYSPPQLRRR